MSYKKEYKKLIDLLSKSIINYYGTNLISMAIYGSVARGRFKPDSDIDLLIILSQISVDRYERIIDFIKNVEDQFKNIFIELNKREINPSLSPIIVQKDELDAIKPILLDMTEDAIILFDRDNFFNEYLAKIKERMEVLGTKKVKKYGGYYWLLKPDYKWGDVIEL